MTEKQIRKALKTLEDQEKPLREALREAIRNRRIPCEHCPKRTRVRDLVYIQTHFYIHPYSCTGGDYWKPGEGNYVCPKCGSVNRLCDFNGRKWVEDLKRFFKSVEDVYGR